MEETKTTETLETTVQPEQIDVEVKAETTENKDDKDVEKILTSVGDEFSKKKTKKRKITLAIISSFVFALSLVIIILSCVKIDLKPSFIEKPTNFYVTIGSKTSTFTGSNEEYNKVYDIFDDTFTSKVMTAIFTGQLDAYEIEEGSVNKGFYQNSYETLLSSSIKSELGDNYIRLNYAEKQPLLKPNGKQYYSAHDVENLPLYYNDVYFSLTDSNKEGKVTLYFATFFKEEKCFKTTITLRGNTFGIYDYVVNM